MGIILIIVGGLWLLAAAYPRRTWEFGHRVEVQGTGERRALVCLPEGDQLWHRSARRLHARTGHFSGGRPSAEEVRADREQRQSACEDVLADFEALVVWDEGRLGNRADLESLAEERNVQLDVTRLELSQGPYDLVSLDDAQGELLFALDSLTMANC